MKSFFKKLKIEGLGTEFKKEFGGMGKAFSQYPDEIISGYKKATKKDNKNIFMKKIK